jgi:hypothetical protein
VQHDDKKGSQAGQLQLLMPMGDACRQGHARDDAVQGQAQSGATPGDIMSVGWVVVMSGVIAWGVFSIGLDIVMMEAKKPFNKKHHKQAGEYPQHGGLASGQGLPSWCGGACLGKCMR